MSDSNFMIVLTVVVVLVVGFIIGMGENSCRHETIGQMRVFGKYGGTVEVCNGADWVPATMPVPK